MSGIVGTAIMNGNNTNGTATLYGDEDTFLKGFNLGFSWDYPDDFSLRDVQDTAFYVHDEESER